MTLEGKTKDNFQKWFLEWDEKNPIKSWVSEDLGLIYLQTTFNALPFSMRKGVYKDYYKSVGIELGNDTPDTWWVMEMEINWKEEVKFTDNDFNNLTEAEMWEKADEIRNEQLKTK